jgi:putative SOS response-associated peptidase YedK
MVGVCGRYVSATKPDDLARYFAALTSEALVTEQPDGTTGTAGLPDNFNVAPTNDVYGVVGDDEGGRRLTTFQWGLVPSWAKDAKATKQLASKMINARSETIASKPAFKPALAKRRCILPADGFYEWKALPAPESGGKPSKQPYFIHRADGEPLAFAGLWERWRDPADPDGPWLFSATIVTTQANETMAPIHDRMPVILPATAWSTWLDRSVTDGAAVAGLMIPAPSSLLTMHPVSTAVGSVRNKGRELIEPIDLDAHHGGGTLFS